MIFTVSLFIAAAATGAFLRFVVSGAFPAPWGTFSANILGSLAMGFLFVYLEKSSSSVRLIILFAFLGSLTTYSSFALDCMKMVTNSQWKMLSLYVTLTNVLCILGCAAGWQVARKLVTKL